MLVNAAFLVVEDVPTVLNILFLLVDNCFKVLVYEINLHLLLGAQLSVILPHTVVIGRRRGCHGCRHLCSSGAVRSPVKWVAEAAGF